MTSSSDADSADGRGPPAARPLTPTHASSDSEERGPGVTPSHASAPGKLILFGEHSVVYGEPAVSLSVTKRSNILLEPSDQDRITVNGSRLNLRQHRFILKAFQVLGIKRGLRVETKSDIPSAAGMGSSAALSVASIAAGLHHLGEDATKARIARQAYETEWRGQGNQGSPTDTSACTLGGGMLIAREPWNEHEPDWPDPPHVSWSLRRGKSRWYAHRLDLPALHLVVAHSGQKGKTSEQVTRVRRFVKRSPAGPDVIKDMGRVTREGLQALRAGDMDSLGELLDEYHFLLNLAGVGTRRLDEMAYVARKHAYGAKITGAGGGGCIVAVTDEPGPCARALERLGCPVYRMDLDTQGVTWGEGKGPFS